MGVEDIKDENNNDINKDSGVGCCGDRANGNHSGHDKAAVPEFKTV